MGGGFGGGGAGADAGGDTQPIGSITPFFLSISLIIRHTAEIHEQVADLLRQLRRLQDLQVSIEVRFITVSDSFFEQIGVDFDFNIQSKVLGKKSTIAVQNPAATASTRPGGTTIRTGGTTAGGTTAGTGTLGGTSGSSTAAAAATARRRRRRGRRRHLGGSLGGGGGSGRRHDRRCRRGWRQQRCDPGPYIVNPLRDYAYGAEVTLVVGTSVGGHRQLHQRTWPIPFNNRGAAGLIACRPTPRPVRRATFGIAFLSDLEVYLFLTAVQGDTRSNLVQAPKVTTFNGAPAFDQQRTETIYYVSSLTPDRRARLGGVLPHRPTPFPNGVTLQVTPVVSADRRYVRMTLSPNFNALEGFDTIQVPAAVGGGGLGGGSAAINGTIQLPRFTVTTVSTTVTVPDGGTSPPGRRQAAQRGAAAKYGVPVLSKTPLAEPSLPATSGIGRRDLQPHADGHPAHHHPRGRGGAAGHSDDRPLTAIGQGPTRASPDQTSLPDLNATGRRGSLFPRRPFSVLLG